MPPRPIACQTCGRPLPLEAGKVRIGDHWYCAHRGCWPPPEPGFGTMADYYRPEDYPRHKPEKPWKPRDTSNLFGVDTSEIRNGNESKW